MTILQTINHKKNELFEVEFYKDEECTEAFDFTNAKNLYIDGLKGDISPLYILKDKYYWRNVYTPYMPHKFSCEPCDNITTLDDITPNLSKYIPEDNAVLFLTQKDWDTYANKIFEVHRCVMFDEWSLGVCKYNNVNKHTIFLPHGTQAELQKAEEVGKYLWENFGIKPNLCVLHCFIRGLDFINEKLSFYHYANHNSVAEVKFSESFINKIITTNSTGILPVQDNERLQVIDCKEIFEEYLKTER